MSDEAVPLSNGGAITVKFEHDRLTRRVHSKGGG
jgi:hypothetical protein